MKSPVAVMVLAVLAAGTAGCSDTMRSYLEKDTPEQQQQVGVRQDLTMPPDLSLAPPGTGAAANDSYNTASANQPLYDDTSAANAAPPADTAPSATAPSATPPAAARPTAADSLYEKAGISLTKPDGTRKTQAELQTEYRQWHLAQKRQQNPNYGTVFNMGNVFNDE
jgi:hypothetical protein